MHLNDLPGASCRLGFSSGLYRGLPEDLLEASHVQLVFRLSQGTTVLMVTAGSGSSQGWKTELFCANSIVAPSQFADRGRANVILFKYADDTPFG